MWRFAGVVVTMVMRNNIRVLHVCESLPLEGKKRYVGEKRVRSLLEEFAL